MRLLRAVILVVAVAIVVFPAGSALAYPPANPVRILPATVEKGATFNFTVNFTAPADNFSAISLTDFGPDSWNVSVNGAWCQPAATANVTGNMSAFAWYLTAYPNGTNFTTLYKVTVPCGAELGNHTFGDGFLGYYIGNSSHIYENIAGDFNVTVIPPAICSTPSIDFYAALGQNPENQTLQLWSSTPCMLNWSLSDDASWLSENQTSGNCTNVHSFVALSANTSGMSLGDYTASITINSTDANNSPRIVPVGLHIRATGTLKGHVSFYRAENPGDPTWETPLVVRFFDNSTKLEVVGWSPINITTDAYGNFTIEDIVIGTYDIGIKNWTSLSKMVYGKNFTGGSVTEANFTTLIEADCDNNDKTESADYSKVLNNYGVRETTNATFWATYELWKADYNRDQKIDGSDYASVLNNYGKRGDIFYYTH